MKSGSFSLPNLPAISWPCVLHLRSNYLPRRPCLEWVSIQVAKLSFSPLYILHIAICLRTATWQSSRPIWQAVSSLLVASLVVRQHFTLFDHNCCFLVIFLRHMVFSCKCCFLHMYCRVLPSSFFSSLFSFDYSDL